jgi:polyphosphate kinase 2 (PPK2 family)
MGFCTDEEYKSFLQEAPRFESMLVRSNIRLFKYYLDISKEEQKERLAERRRNPLKQWKISPIDAAAIRKWSAYSDARDAMLVSTSHEDAPWHVVKADRKKLARLNIIRHLLSVNNYADKDTKHLKFDPGIVFRFDEKALSQGKLAH